MSQWEGGVLSPTGAAKNLIQPPIMEQEEYDPRVWRDGRGIEDEAAVVML